MERSNFTTAQLEADPKLYRILQLERDNAKLTGELATLTERSNFLLKMTQDAQGIARVYGDQITKLLATTDRLCVLVERIERRLDIASHAKLIPE
jgi:hypothetical protein